MVLVIEIERVILEKIELLAAALQLDEDQKPFAWQLRLLDSFLSDNPPQALDIPTGLGKTSVMAIWLVAKALGAKLPNRLVYVVDRRVVVDQATHVATELRKLVAENEDLAERLQLRGRSLPISTLRGQFIDNKEWLEDPSVPAIIIGTVDMVGSRLLFEGYGVSRKMRPYHAGLLGIDSLVVLDEAHLVPPFEALLAGIKSLRRATPLALPEFQTMSLSATGETEGEAVFSLIDEDWQDKVVAQRLGAKKKLRIQEIESPKDLAARMAEQALTLSQRDGATRVVVFCDKRKDAENVRALVEKGFGKDQSHKTELLVGGRRGKEREDAARSIQELGFVKATAPPEVPVVLVATSAGEVGVDLDADHLVCDLVAWERMVQRFGRVNRRGSKDAEVWVFLEAKSVIGDQIAAVEKTPREKWKPKDISDHEVLLALLNKRVALESMPEVGEGVYDVSPGAIYRNRKLSVLKTASTPKPLHPLLSDELVCAWSMTSLREHTGRPSPQPWIRGWVNDRPQTTLIWRKYLPLDGQGRFLDQQVTAFFEAASPHAAEKLETETFRVMELLTKIAKRGDLQSPLVGFVLSASGECLRSVATSHLEDKRDKDRLERDLYGNTLVIKASLGGLGEKGMLDSASTSEVPTPEEDGWENGDAAPTVPFRVLKDSEPDENWKEVFRFIISETESETHWLSVQKWKGGILNEDGRALAKFNQRLEEHQSAAALQARAIAGRIGLPESYAASLELAARRHDEGKRESVWQEAFSAPKDAVYAKTRGPLILKKLNGYRHELMSEKFLPEDPEFGRLPEALQQLVRHIVVAHHGYARPTISCAGSAIPPSLEGETIAEIAKRFVDLQDIWGPWGLAWWEALLRAADQRSSRGDEI